MYQLSNQVTLGISEKAAIDNLKNITTQLVNQELNAQKRMAESLETQDRILRSIGVLKYAKLISCDEAMSLLSNIRFGISCGLIDDIDTETIDTLIGEVQPATMIVNKRKELTPQQRDKLRAEIIKNTLR
jgi:protein arginine kinase